MVCDASLDSKAVYFTSYDRTKRAQMILWDIQSRGNRICADENETLTQRHIDVHRLQGVQEYVTRHLIQRLQILSRTKNIMCQREVQLLDTRVCATWNFDSDIEKKTRVLHHSTAKRIQRVTVCFTVHE